MAATVACNLAGSTTVGLSGQMIKIASGVSGGWTSVMINRSALVTRLEDSSMGDDVDTVTSQGHRGLGERCEREPGPRNADRTPFQQGSPARYVERSVCNLILLCQWHHTAVHEGGVTITREGQGWVFRKPDGRPCEWWVDDQNLARHLDFALRRRQAHDRLAAVDSFQHPDAQTIRPRWTGEPFDLHACVQALFAIKLPTQTEDLDQQAA
jgi:hypothetical protein